MCLHCGIQWHVHVHMGSLFGPFCAYAWHCPTGMLALAALMIAQASVTPHDLGSLLDAAWTCITLFVAPLLSFSAS